MLLYSYLDDLLLDFLKEHNRVLYLPTSFFCILYDKITTQSIWNYQNSPKMNDAVCLTNIIYIPKILEV